MTPPASPAFRARPRRNPWIHGAALLLAFASFALLALWMTGPGTGAPPSAWLAADVAMGVLFALEFFTRSGFRWRPGRYVLGHLFDFVATVPALALAGRGIAHEGLLLGVVLVARGIRCIDRALGDGFVQRLAFVVLEGFEEEIADRVTLTLAANLEKNLAQTRLGTAVGDALAENKASVLARIQSAAPQAGVAAAVAQFVGLDKAIAAAEARTYDAVVEVLRSQEVDDALRAAIGGSFASFRAEVGRRAWRERMKELWRR